MKRHRYRDATDAQELRELRSKAQKLTRENKRLRKELEKFLARQDSSVDSEEENNYTPPKIKAENKCPQCSSEQIRVLDLGIKRLQVCPICKYKKVLKDEPSESTA